MTSSVISIYGKIKSIKILPTPNFWTVMCFFCSFWSQRVWWWKKFLIYSLSKKKKPIYIYIHTHTHARARTMCCHLEIWWHLDEQIIYIYIYIFIFIFRQSIPLNTNTFPAIHIFSHDIIHKFCIFSLPFIY